MKQSDQYSFSFNNRIELRFPSDSEWLFIISLLFCVIVSFFIIPADKIDTYVLHIFFLLGSLFFIILSDLFNHQKTSLLLFIIGIFLLGFLMSFRNKTGVDDVRYEIIFHSIIVNDFTNYFFHTELEKGYILLNYIIYRLGITDYCHALSIISYFSFFIWGYAIWQFRGTSFLAIIITILWSNYYFVVLYAALIRIFIAIPLAFIALTSIPQNNIRKFICFLCLATLFHRSSLILILFIPLFHKSVIKHWIKFVCGLFIITPMCFFVVVKVIVPLLGQRYTGYAVLGNFKVSISDFDILPIWLIGLYFLQFVNTKKRSLYIVGMVSLSLSMIFSIYSSMINFGRLIFFSNLGVLIIGSQIYKQRPIGIIEKFIPGIFVVYSFIYVLHSSILNPVYSEFLFPYRTYLFQ